ncbi:hypothetical protein PENTCL1PPCAC_450, partial [Pristionchus entomophagus]
VERDEISLQIDVQGYALQTTELRALDNVREAFLCLNDPLDASTKHRESFMKSDKTPTDIMNIMDITMRRLVKMSKKLSTFNELSNEGKFSLLKEGMVEMLTVRSYDSCSTNELQGTGQLQVPAQYTVSVDMFDKLNAYCRTESKTRFMKFVDALHEDVRKNELALNIMMLVVLFTPRLAVSDERDRALVIQHGAGYYVLLYRYLESLYGADAKQYQAGLPTALSLLRSISDKSTTLFKGAVKPEEAEPLAREFFKTE